jgi:hypothetical protein
MFMDIKCTWGWRNHLYVLSDEIVDFSLDFVGIWCEMEEQNIWIIGDLQHLVDVLEQVMIVLTN